MNRMHIHIAVDDLDKNIHFYSALFGGQPTTQKDDYAKWSLDDPAVNFAISSRGNKTGLDHVGIQTDSEEGLNEIQGRLEAAEIAGEAQENTACCYAKSDKYWTMDPQGIAWESFHTLDSIPTFNEQQEDESSSACCVPSVNSNSCC